MDRSGEEEEEEAPLTENSNQEPQSVMLFSSFTSLF